MALAAKVSPRANRRVGPAKSRPELGDIIRFTAGQGERNYRTSGEQPIVSCGKGSKSADDSKKFIGWGQRVREHQQISSIFPAKHSVDTESLCLITFNCFRSRVNQQKATKGTKRMGNKSFLS
jgi:hypothetical protein